MIKKEKETLEKRCGTFNKRLSKIEEKIDGLLINSGENNKILKEIHKEVKEEYTPIFWRFYWKKKDE